MKYLFTTSFFIFLTINLFSQVDFIHQDLEKAKSQAKEEKRYIMVDVYADWCGWCKKMDATTFKNEDVTSFIESNLVPLKINTGVGKGKEFATKYGVRGLPTIVYLDYEGNLMKTVPGYKTAKQLLLDLKPYELKVKKTAINMSTYFEAREQYEIELNERLIKLNDAYSKSFQLGESKDVFAFDQFKYELNKTSTSEKITNCDLFYKLGENDFIKASEKLLSSTDYSEFSTVSSEFLVYKMIKNKIENPKLLNLINEFSTKSNNPDLLETKALVQYLMGDKKDASGTVKKVKKMLKKKNQPIPNSLKILSGIISN